MVLVKQNRLWLSPKAMLEAILRETPANALKLSQRILGHLMSRGKYQYVNYSLICAYPAQ